MNNMAESTVTAKQFVSFENISVIVVGLLIAICAWVWTSRVAVVDGRFEKIDTKLEQVVITLTKMEAKMATKDDMPVMSRRISANEKATGILNAKVEHLEN
ncbi:MAG: hypothetical protein ACI8WB_000691 [Phenylobacterium sp.]|jgi:hypothetical protein